MFYVDISQLLGFPIVCLTLFKVFPFNNISMNIQIFLVVASFLRLIDCKVKVTLALFIYQHDKTRQELAAGALFST